MNYKKLMIFGAICCIFGVPFSANADNNSVSVTYVAHELTGASVSGSCGAMLEVGKDRMASIAKIVFPNKIVKPCVAQLALGDNTVLLSVAPGRFSELDTREVAILTVDRFEGFENKSVPLAKPYCALVDGSSPIEFSHLKVPPCSQVILRLQ
ncbi:MAG: hypothetical protein A3E84_04820 [Gammaproteobacteria bacterium RIFCSPHIGHO2_12_FULL_42_13]|nr:MAG: hypothetical protein A3E84_04820 [Gammaproteobacteria bacterium RIFCSPHIGHO2_12_FULL_42_13]